MVRAKACAARHILVDTKDTKRHVLGVHIRPLTRKDTLPTDPLGQPIFRSDRTEPHQEVLGLAARLDSWP